MLLAAEPGTELLLSVEGDDAVEAMPKLSVLLGAESVDQWEEEPM